MSKFKIGDIVRPNADIIEDFSLRKGEVVSIDGDGDIDVKILESTNENFSGICFYDQCNMELWEEPAKKEDDEKMKKSDIYKTAIAEVIESNNLPTDKKIDVLAQLYKDRDLAIFSEEQERKANEAVCCGTQSNETV